MRMVSNELSTPCASGQITGRAGRKFLIDSGRHFVILDEGGAARLGTVEWTCRAEFFFDVFVECKNVWLQ
jgi:hypothetical protein